MKKLIAITLLCLHTFSICGHLLLYQYSLFITYRIFNERISQNVYNLNDLVEIKIPLVNPINQNWRKYASVSGRVQFRLKSYNYVKLKLTPHAIYLACIPNYEKTKLSNHNIINAKDIDDIPVKKKDHVPFGKLADIGKYNPGGTCFAFKPAIIMLSVKKEHFAAATIDTEIQCAKPPPKFIV